MENKQQYTKPELVVYGDVTALTQGGAIGATLDRNYSVGETFDPAHSFSPH